MIVTMLGSSGTTPRMGRPLTSLYASVQDKGILIDCGEGTQLGFAYSKLGFSNLCVICFTHYHPDHVLGLPGLISSINANLMSDSKDGYKNVFIIGPVDSRGIINGLMGCILHDAINYTFYEVKGQGIRTFDFGSFIIEAFPVRHTVPCLGFNVLEKKNPSVILDKANNSGVDKKYWHFLQSGMVLDDGRDLSVLTEGSIRYNKLSYVTDTLYFDELADRVKGANLAVLEGMHYTEDGYQREGGHMLYSEAATVAANGGVEELWLTHFSPKLSNPYDGIDVARNIFHNTSCSKRGKRKEI